ncbi:MAG: hypothetical protein WC869_11875 [Phycisphaerae bacterium]
MTLRAAGGSFLLQWHAWRGFGRDRGLFWFEYRAGFITLAMSRGFVTDTIRKLLDKLP